MVQINRRSLHVHLRVLRFDCDELLFVACPQVLIGSKVD